LKAVRASFELESVTLENHYPQQGQVDLHPANVTEAETSAMTRLYTNYTAGLLRSKFVFAPRGSGIDSYRVWEALAAGCIPVLERTLLMEKLLHGLPHVMVNDWSEVTPRFLLARHAEIVADSAKTTTPLKYDYGRLLARRVTQRIFAHVTQTEATAHTARTATARSATAHAARF